MSTRNSFLQRCIERLYLRPSDFKEDLRSFKDRLRILPKQALGFTIALTFMLTVMLGPLVTFFWFQGSNKAYATVAFIGEDVCPLGSWFVPNVLVLDDPIIFRRPIFAGTSSEEAIPPRDIKSVEMASGLIWDTVKLERSQGEEIDLCFLRRRKDPVGPLAYSILKDRYAR